MTSRSAAARRNNRNANRTNHGANNRVRTPRDGDQA